MDHATEDVVRRVTAALGWRPSAWERVRAERGRHSNMSHWIVAGRGRAFVKIAHADLTAAFLRREHTNLLALDIPVAPRVLGWDDGDDRPVLALEDLSGATWPPPWSDDSVAAVLAALATVRSTPPPPQLDAVRPNAATSWATIRRAPNAFLSVGLCSRAWLDAALPALEAAALAAPLAGDRLVHMDVRSDNVCIAGGRAVLVDWNHAAVANGDLDVAFWLPSLAAEGGPDPEAILPGAAELSAWVAGFFCSQAGLPDIPDAPHVRPLQVAQARAALPWAARQLGLPPPG
jgi:hypothetical protein